MNSEVSAPKVWLLLFINTDYTVEYFIGILNWMNMINPLIFLSLLLKKKKKKEGLKAVNIDHPLNLPNISGEKICVFNCNWLNKYKHRGWLLPRVGKGRAVAG